MVKTKPFPDKNGKVMKRVILKTLQKEWDKSNYDISGKPVECSDPKGSIHQNTYVGLVLLIFNSTQLMKTKCI